MFIVPRKAAGISVQVIPSFAVNVYEACEVTFDDVLLPSSSLLGIEGAGFRQLIGMLNAERLCAAANALGIARGAMQLAAQYARERQAFGKALSQMQVVQHKLASVAMAYEVAWTYLVDAADKGDKGEAIDVASSMAKVCASNAAELAVQVGMEVMGANGFDRRIPMQRYFRDHRLYVIAPLNNDMSKSLIAERYFGFDRA
jgi:acyl-CoA dehydrogenase